MPLIRVENLTLAYGAATVIQQLSFHLEAGQRVAVVGANGSGKSTLLRAVMGALQPAAGTITFEPTVRTAHLPQELEAGPHETVYQDALHSREDILALRRELAELEGAIAGAVPERAAGLLQRYGEAQHDYERLDGYSYDSRVAEVLAGVGLPEAEQALPPAALSGGQRRRLALARLLLQEADLFLLDEPTNHLDLKAIEWLESFLRLQRAGMLVVSHDRRFLDRVADDVLELEAGRGEWYPGSYSQYVRLRQERRLRRQKEYDAQQEFIARTEAFVRRYRAGQRAREARGRQTRLDRLPRIARPPEDRQIRIHLKAAPTSRIVFASDGVRVGYAARTLAVLPAFTVEAQDRIAVIGPNGSGKTSVLKVLLGELAPLEGRIKTGAQVRLRYYDQHLADLNPDRSILEELQDASGLPGETLRQFLGKILFSGQDAFKAIRSLSGGEKSRVALAKLMLDDAGVLLLDEPTNHLDIPSQEVLETALQGYGGTLIFVSHDRYFIDAIATRVWSIEEGEVGMHLGNYTDLENRRRRRVAAASANRRASFAGRAPAVEAAPASPVEGIEAEIAELEAAVSDMEAQLADPRTYDDPAALAGLTSHHHAASQRLRQLYQAWEQAAEQAGR